MLMIGSFAAFVIFSWRNEDRDWKRYQRAFYAREDDRARAAYASATDPREKAELAQKVKALRGAGLEIKQIILDKEGRADRCLTCHLDMEEHPEKHPTLEGRTFEEVGCTICHGGEGLATSMEDAHRWEKKEGARATFVGAEKCKECHKEVHESWESRKMVKAFDLLQGLEKEDAGCLPCHTTGYGQGGYEPRVPPNTILGIGADGQPVRKPDFRGVWCEACHGPGSEYVKIFEAGGTWLDAVKQGGLVLPSPRTCIQCHDKKWSANFSFQGYFKDDALHKVDWWREKAKKEGS